MPSLAAAPAGAGLTNDVSGGAGSGAGSAATEQPGPGMGKAVAAVAAVVGPLDQVPIGVGGAFYSCPQIPDPSFAPTPDAAAAAAAAAAGWMQQHEQDRVERFEVQEPEVEDPEQQLRRLLQTQLHSLQEQEAEAELELPEPQSLPSSLHKQLQLQQEQLQQQHAATVLQPLRPLPTSPGKRSSTGGTSPAGEPASMLQFMIDMR